MVLPEHVGKVQQTLLILNFIYDRTGQHEAEIRAWQ